VLGAEEVPPVPLVSFVARQLGVSRAAFIRYRRCDQTRHEQLAELLTMREFITEMADSLLALSEIAPGTAT